MPFDKFLNNNSNVAPVKQTGATPAYDPFGKFEEDYNKLNKKVINDVIDFTFSKTGNEGQTLNIDASKYADYDIYINDIDTEAELNAERAKNQSAWEQTGKAIVNAGAEIFLGIPIGFADIADALINVGNEHNDYQNIVSSTLTDWKHEINERMKVYQENPEQALDMDDYGWWMSHAPSVVSSISLMVPALGVSGTLGKLGKGLSSISKLKSFNKVANKFNNFVNISTKTRDTLGAMGKAAIEGATMRVGENYMEARETYNQIKQYATEQFANMTDADKEEFYKNNPQYKGKDENYIIEDIASNAADTTFDANLINGVFDIIQIYGMRNMWNNRITRDITGSARLNRVNRTAARMFGQDAKAIQEAAKGATLWGKTKNGIIDFLDDSIRLGKTEWTEGIEEAVNYIGSQEGIYAGKKVFDKDLEEKYLSDYLRDPFLWESALWGVIGGVVFGQAYPAAIKGIGKLQAKSLGQEFITAEKQKEAEIYSRAAITENYINELQQIENGQNPFDNNNPIEESDKALLKELAGKRYIDALVVNAANAGNLDLLESFMHDSNFNKGFREKLGINEQETVEILSKFDNSFNETKSSYIDVLNKANKAGANFEIAKLIASEAVDAKHAIDTWTTLRNNTRSKFDSLIAQPHLSNEVSSYIEDAKDGIIINEIEQKRRQLEALERNTVVDKNKKKDSVLEAQKDIDRLLKIRPVDGLDDITRRTKLEAARRLYREQSEIFNAYVQLAQRENVLLYAQENNKTDDVSIKNKVVEYKNFFDKARKKVVDGAFKDITEMYRRYGSEEVNKQLNNEENSIEDADKKLINNAKLALKLDEEGNKILNKRLKDIARISDIERTRRAENPDDVREEEEEGNQFEGATSEGASPAPSTLPTGGQTPPAPGASRTSPPVIEIIEPTPARTEAAQINPPVEDGRGETPEEESPASVLATPPSSSEAPAIVIPTDEVEQTILAQEIVEEELTKFDDDVLFDATNENQIYSTVRQAMLNLGFKEGIIEDVLISTIRLYNGNEVLSSEDILDKSVVVTNMLAFNRNANVNNLKRALEEFINTEVDGKKYGREFDGKIYFSMSDLMSYLKNIPSSFLYEEIFNSLKTYIFSSDNTDYIVTDADTIKAIDKYNIHDYVLLYERARKTLIKDLSNEVNIDNLFEGTNEQIAARVVEFSKLTTDKELSVEYDKNNKRIYVRRNGKDLGYMGVANEFDTEYAKSNENWIYTLNIDDKKIVHSDFMNWMLQFITDPNLNQQILSWFRTIEANQINFNDAPIYDESVKDNTYYAYQNYVAFLNWLLANGGNEFIAKDVTSVTNKAIAANHIIKVLKRAARDLDSADVYKWFEHMASSYLMAEEISNNPTKKVKISRILPGTINTEQITEYEGNPIDKAVVGYDENKHQLGVITKDSSDKRILTMSKDVSSISADSESIPSTLNVVLRLPRPDGTFAYAACRQLPISSVISNPEVKKIIDGVLSEVKAAVYNYFNTDGSLAFDNFVNHLGSIFGDNSLIRGISVSKTKTGGAKIDYNKKTIFFLNPATSSTSRGNGAGKNINYYPNASENPYYASNKAAAANRVVEVIRDAIMQNCTFAVGKDIINDGAVKNKIINPFISRVNNKTIIQVGNYKGEYKSYQDFLVSNGLINTKLRNDTTPRVVADGVIAYGNFVYSKNHTGLEVRLPIVVPKAVGNIPVVSQQIDVIGTSVTSEDIDDIVENVNNPDNFKKYINNIGISTGLMTDKMLSFYNEIFDTGILQMPIAVKYRTGHKAYAVYDKITETVYVDRSRWEYAIRHSKPTIARFMNVIIHENIHGYIDSQNKAGNNMSKKITNAFIPIYNEYRAWFDAQSEEFKSNKNNRVLARIKEDGRELTDIDYEEFMIEAMTNGAFMQQLNNIKTTPTEKIKKPTLFAKIMNIIANLFGINIKTDSLLAKAQAATQSIFEDNINNEETVEKTSEEATEIPFTEEPSDSSDGQTENNGYFNNDIPEFPFAETEDMLTIPDMKNRLPYSAQARFSSLLDTGTIGFVCK